MEILKNIRVILASKSPRRRELLSKIIESFEIIVSDADESVEVGTHPRDAVEILAVKKGEIVAKENPDALVISSDTLVELSGVALGKPRDKDDAFSMLSSLSGKAHNVHTGVAVSYRGRVLSGRDTTAVYFKEITPSQIEEYIETGEPMDKAGSYAIQGIGGKFIEKYEGDFDTVVGLSLKLTEKLIDGILTL